MARVVIKELCLQCPAGSGMVSQAVGQSRGFLWERSGSQAGNQLGNLNST